VKCAIGNLSNNFLIGANNPSFWGLSRTSEHGKNVGYEGIYAPDLMHDEVSQVVQNNAEGFSVAAADFDGILGIVELKRSKPKLVAYNLTINHNQFFNRG
jgi:hypothetical protein